MATRFAVMTVEEFCEVMQIARSTFYEWKAKKLIPTLRKLPNGQLRIRVDDFHQWFDSLPEAA
jgi:excisionase family DNA binding protein